jgi:hypothetical protein
VNPSITKTTAGLVLAVVIGAHSALAQQILEDDPRACGEAAVAGDLVMSPSTAAALQPIPSGQVDEGRACPGCPARRLGTSFLQVTYLHVVYELANLLRGQDTAKITPETWWLNMKRGWEWDLDDFVVNQIGHPYQGNNYFTAGRANGLNFWESSALTAFGSGTWEYFGETNQASLNDFVNTTLGGIALGEMFHRVGWLIRNTHATGRKRLWREIGAAAVDPMTGLNRFLSGDSARVVDKPPAMVPSTLGAVASAGVAWRGSNTRDVTSTTDPFVELDLLYGDLERGRSRVPYDGFAVRLAFGDGSSFSEARVRGRLLGQSYGNGLQLTVLQGYQYNNNAAYRFGEQSVEVNAGITRNLTSRTSLWATGWGGLIVLGAVDSIPPGGKVEEVVDPDAPQGVSTGPRYYDYGPGTKFGGFMNFQRDGRPWLMFSYDAHHLHVLDGVRANHLLQRARADVKVPLRGQLGLGFTWQFFDRRTFFQTPDAVNPHFYFPQYRVALTWSGS